MGPELRSWIQTHPEASQVPSRHPHRPREAPEPEKAESALNDKDPKINNSPITGFKTHIQNQPRLFNKSLRRAGPACHRESVRAAECQLSTPRTTVN